jgi:hypothetical protein
MKTESLVKLNAKQIQFCNSKNRFPAFVGGWGCGKTMCGILRGMLLSETFSDNLGLIVRKKFTDLRDSTLKDFERYTGLSVKKDDKEVKLPNGSVIMFRHGEELSGLQNVNLGWFMIEQGEEFESAEQFDLLRGRLRRNESRIRQGMVIANTAGHNWIWDRWKNRQLEGYELTEANIDDNREHLPADTLADWERLRIESPRKYNRYVLNSWEDYDLEGAYYAALMSDALKEGRIRSITFDPDSPVYTSWDLGVRDSTAIWFAQAKPYDRVRLIDYYESHGQPLKHYAEILRQKSDEYGYKYARHFGPHDLRGKSLQTGKATIEVAYELGIDFEIVEMHRIEDGIEAVRVALPDCEFDVDKCKHGITCLNHYKQKKEEKTGTDDRPEFSSKPLHDWASHGADSFRYLVWALRYHDVQGKGLMLPSYTGVKNEYRQGVMSRIADINAIDDMSDIFSEDEDVCYTV